MLEVTNLNQYYGGSHILRNVKLEVPDGKLTVLLGRNGVGKTTLLRCLMGVVAPKSGTIAWRGEQITKLAPHARVAQGLAYVPQGRDIFPRLTVEENLLVGAASRKAPKKIPDRIYELFPVLKDMRARRGGDLSGGQQQQLAIGRALMSEPQLLILDHSGHRPHAAAAGRGNGADGAAGRAVLRLRESDCGPLLGDEPRRDHRGWRRRQYGR
jgi:urea transport system ATP-binding protein